MAEARHHDLLRALPHGARMWLRAGGRSLWPLVLDDDQLQIDRGDASHLHVGDIALIENPEGQLVAHLVQALAPLVTVSSVGVVDPPAREVLGRVVALKRNGLRVDLPARGHLVLRHVPTVARALKHVPGLRQLVRKVRDR
jgi:hypothetical protein